MNDKPSSLAIKLAARFHPKGPDAAKDIDNVIRWHQRDERENIRKTNQLLPNFCDNIGVFRNQDRGEFFELQLLPSEPHAPYEVQFKRYAVPGRYWIYGFNYQHEGSGRVAYGSESNEPLAKSLKLIEIDLNKPQVVKLFELAFSVERVVCRYRHDTLTLLSMLAPKSKAYRATLKICEKMMEARKVRIETAKKEEK
jgi:hypothetical protein